MSLSKPTSALCGLLIGLGLLALALKGIHPQEILAVLTDGSWTWLWLAAFLYAFGFFLRSFRWSLILRPQRKISPVRLFPFVMIGFFINLAGLRVGELARAYSMGRNLDFSKSTAFATILVERAFDALAITLILTISSFSLIDSPLKIWVIPVSTVTIILALGSFILVTKNPHRLTSIICTFLPERWRSKAEEAVKRFHDGLVVLQSPSQILQTALCSLAIWTLEACVIATVARVAHLSLDVMGSLTVLSSLALSSLIPTPGAIGIYEQFGLMAYTLLGISQRQAVATVLLLHAFQLLFVGSIGLLSFLKEGSRSCAE